MKAFNKVGFHTSVGGNPTGIGDWMRALDAANIPFFIKAADSMTGLFDAQELIRARPGAVPHTLVFRRSIHDNQDFDVPDYNKEPEAAAAEHWARHKQHLPPELEPDWVWIETINELRKEVEWADWIGKFAFFNGQMAMADGFKFSAFGYSTGTPDEGAWETDGMLQYLELCQQHPDRLSVALHEYSLRVEDIWFLRGDHLGRFEKLFAACDKHKIRRPKVLITEWGWTHERVPPPAKAIEDIRQVGELYGRYPEVLGAAIWYLGPSFGGIANLAQKLIKPVADFTLSHTFDLPDPAPPDVVVDPPPPPIEVSPAPPTGPANARFIKDVTVPDDQRLEVGARFTKTWRVENSGAVPWRSDFRLSFAGGTQMHEATEMPLPAAVPGGQVDVSIPMQAPAAPGVYFSDWRFHDAAGNAFGDVIYVRIVAEAAVPPPAGVSDSRFVADVTIPDDMLIEHRASFVKSWRVRNAGQVAWGPGFSLEFVGGTNMAGVSRIELPVVVPGAEVDLSIPMRAPAAPGMYFADWRMKDSRGAPFGEIIYVRIQVPSPAGDALAPPLSQRDPLWAGERLGLAGSPKTIGEWGCLLTCFAMVANGYGRRVNPLQLNHAMTSRGGFLDGFLTKWNALSSVYTDIVYNGRLEPSPTLIDRINASLAAGNPVTVQVDFTRDTPYTANDQHWVLIVARDGEDYRINDPWLLPAQEASLRDRYGRTGRPLREAILAAIFYKTTRPELPVDPGAPATGGQLQRGMNVNPDAPHSNPFQSDDLKGMDWVRYVFKLDARVNEAERGNLEAAFAQYDPIVAAYSRMGVKTLFVINQETVWGRAPWTGNNAWQAYASELAAVARQIGQRYSRFGSQVGYEIWNEGDLPHNPASVFVPPDQFALMLRETAGALRAATPDSPLVLGGLASGPGQSIDYLHRCLDALGGAWPVDAIGIHPYGRWATQAPFDWGQHFGTLGEAFAQYRAAFADIPFWITELGVAADTEIGPVHYPAIGTYIEDVYRHVEERHLSTVPVVIWFAWSDWMRNAGILTREGARKPHVYPAFRAVRNRELM